jgi:hypothetical protein
MIGQTFRVFSVFICFSALFLASACDALVDRSHASASITHKAFSDATSVWTDVFTYHPPAPPQLAQTRYCYKMASDIVCYDSVQPTLTAKLVGYQDGEKMSWIQPGGGSLGVSGGNPVALQPVQIGAVESLPVIEVKTPMSHTAVQETSKVGEIQSINLAPAK